MKPTDKFNGTIFFNENLDDDPTLAIRYCAGVEVEEADLPNHPAKQVAGIAIAKVYVLFFIAQKGLYGELSHELSRGPSILSHRRCLPYRTYEEIVTNTSSNPDLQEAVFNDTYKKNLMKMYGLTVEQYQELIKKAYTLVADMCQPKT